MSNILELLAYFAVAPFVPFILVWFLVYFTKKEKKLATKWAMDVTTAFLFFTVAALYNMIFTSSFGPYLLLLIFLLAFGLLGNAQHRKQGKPDLKKAARAVWRMGFLGLALAYVLFMFIGLTKSITTV